MWKNLSIGFVVATTTIVMTGGTAVAAAPLGVLEPLTSVVVGDNSEPHPNYEICKRPNHLFPIPGGDYTHFYQCDHRYVPQVRPCPRNTVFHERIQVCDWPANVPEARNGG